MKGSWSTVWQVTSYLAGKQIVGSLELSRTAHLLFIEVLLVVESERESKRVWVRERERKRERGRGERERQCVCEREGVGVRV